MWNCMQFHNWFFCCIQIWLYVIVIFLEQISELSCLSRETELRTMEHVFYNVNIVKQ